MHLDICEPHSNPKHITDTQKRKQASHDTTKSHQSQREQKKRGTEKNYKNNEKAINKMVLSTDLTIIALSINDLNAPIKRHRVVEWIKKKKTRPIYLLYTRHSLQT